MFAAEYVFSFLGWSVQGCACVQVSALCPSFPVRGLIPARSAELFPLTGSSPVAVNASNLIGN